MKKFILSFAVIAALGFTSCSSDDDNNDGGTDTCETCSFDLLGTVVSSEYCDNGDGTMDVTTEGTTETVDLEGQSFATVISSLEGAGFTCN